MKETAQDERTGRLLGLGLLLALACVAWVRHDVAPIVSSWVFVALFVPAAAFTALLRVRPKTWGREGKYLDYWSIPHFLVGVFAYLLGVDLLYVFAVAAVWELIELAADEPEYTTNRLTDVVLAVAGWLATYAADAIR